MDEKLLSTLAPFQGLSKRDRRLIAQHTDEVDVPAGTVLVREGQRAYEVFILEEGTAAVRHGDEHVADLGPGDVLGEMGVLADAPRNADVVTTSPVRAAVLTAHEMRAIALAVPELGDRLRAMAGQRSA